MESVSVPANDESSVFDSATDSQNYDTSPSNLHKKKRKRATTAKPAGGRKTVADLFTLISDVKEQNDALIRKFDSVDSRVTLVENSILDIKTASDGINSNLLKLQTDINRRIQSHDVGLNNLNGEIECLNAKVTSLFSDNDKMYSEINKLNLILSGLPDRVSESAEQLTIEINRLFSDMVGQKIAIDCAFRLGQYTDRHPRRIKIRMHSLSDRNLVWNHRTNAAKPLYVNDDISQNMRRIHGKLRHERRDILANNPAADVWIDWRTLSIKQGGRPQQSSSTSSATARRITSNFSSNNNFNPSPSSSQSSNNFLGQR